MRHYSNTTWWDFAELFDLLICDSGPAGCRKKWSPWVHKRGRVDPIGMIHWDGWNRRTTIKGLRRFLMYAAYAQNSSYRDEPKWLGIYHASVWATRMSKNVLGIEIPYEQSAADRQRVIDGAKAAGVRLKHDYSTVFWWAHWKPERAKISETRGALDG